MHRLIATLLPLVLVPVLAGGLDPAGAAARVTLKNPDGDAVVDPTYATTLTVSGLGFGSIKNGHGGIYVLFGVVKGAWQPSKGGTSGSSYLTVPDSQSRANAGYARFVAFPGSDTADSSNSGTISADGTWRTTITVPGGVFTTYDTKQKAVQVDCRVSTCGVITIGAHGVSNARNETFTPVRVAKLAATTRSTSQTTGTSRPATAPVAPVITAPAIAAPVVSGTPKLEVDRASARPGRVLAFNAEGLTPGSQVSATFENGRAAVGPMTVGANGQVAGVFRLPTDLRTGTYELRIVGSTEPVSVRFGVLAPQVADPDSGWNSGRLPTVFAIGSAVVLAGALLFVGVRRRRVRHVA